MNSRKKTFILGLGCQKCGTSWLYQYLAQSQFFCEGFAKEYHVWDALDEPILNRFKVHQKSSFLRRLFFNVGLTKIQSKRYLMQNDPNFYFDYFASLLSNQKFLTADITPSYSALKAERLEKIVRSFDERNITTKAIILLREPLSRMKSAVRFQLDRKINGHGIIDRELNFEAALGQYYVSEHSYIRTRYDKIIAEAQQVFNEDQLYIGFYENMFSPVEISRVSEFLGVDSNSEYAKVKVNKTHSEVELTDIDEIVKAHYADVYDFCFKKFPITKTLWESKK